MNDTSLYGQGFCQIGYLTFYYPKIVNAGQKVNVITGVGVFSCVISREIFRVDFYDSSHSLLSSNSSRAYGAPLNGGVAVNVTNVITVPQTPGGNPVYVTAYVLAPSGDIIASYHAYFDLFVGSSSEIMTTTSVAQPNSQSTTSTAALSTVARTATVTTTATLSTTILSATTIPSQVVPTFSIRNDELYNELAALFAILSLVALSALFRQRRKKGH